MMDWLTLYIAGVFTGVALSAIVLIVLTTRRKG